MKFARTRQVLQAAAENHADRHHSAPNPRESWPAWTATLAFDLARPAAADRRPQLVADRTPRRDGKAVGR